MQIFLLTHPNGYDSAINIDNGMIPWLEGNAPFPDPASALSQPNGLLAAGGDLSPQRLLAAYQRGIFPWYNHGEPILWWSPDPRMVLRPGDLRIRRSLGKTLRNKPWKISLDQAFSDVVSACAAPRGRAANAPHPDQTATGTWINPAMQGAYARLHELGWAHSVEVRLQDELVGGLYGVAIGRVFFGESMFSRTRDASKVALVALTRLMLRHGVALIDCQMHTSHLQSLGAATMDRISFLEQIGSLIHCTSKGGTDPASQFGFGAGSWRNEPASILLIQPGTSGPCRN